MQPCTTASNALSTEKEYVRQARRAWAVRSRGPWAATFLRMCTLSTATQHRRACSFGNRMIFCCPSTSWPIGRKPWNIIFATKSGSKNGVQQKSPADMSKDRPGGTMQLDRKIFNFRLKIIRGKQARGVVELGVAFQHTPHNIHHCCSTGRVALCAGHNPFLDCCASGLFIGTEIALSADQACEADPTRLVAGLATSSLSAMTDFCCSPSNARASPAGAACATRQTDLQSSAVQTHSTTPTKSVSSLSQCGR